MNHIELYGQFVPFITTAQGFDFSKTHPSGFFGGSKLRRGRFD